ncbi:MAG: hypothetical protein FJ096_03740 [Deltaproteobacteria bacterium]|nr:hypothetical protein [Deltaproteobacteria bacterium]
MVFAAIARPLLRLSALVGLAFAALRCADEPSALPVDPTSSSSETTTVGTGGTGTGGGGGATAGAGGEASGGGAPITPPGDCSKEGGQACGGNGIGGPPDTLYVCQGGQYVVDHVCKSACEPMPNGVPDRCPEDVVAPKALVASLEVKPYVESSCEPTTYDGWPYEAKVCTYSAGGLKATVTVANPPAARVAQWIADASNFIPALWHLRKSAPDSYEQGLITIAKHTLGQSSRIFPLEGGIIENMGNGYVNYPFLKGVTQGCNSGCYCRINSLHRTDYCGFVAFLGDATYDACIAKVGASQFTAGWSNQCLQNHIDSWESPSNAHFRARAWQANKEVKAECTGANDCSASKVLAMVFDAYN